MRSYILNKLENIIGMIKRKSAAFPDKAENKQDMGLCEHCGSAFPYVLLHNGFNDSAYAYCDSCGMTAVLDAWKTPNGIQIKFQTVIKPEDEKLLRPCDCGGLFKSNACPRCLHCHEPLSADSAQQWLEANAPGTAKDWRWQRSWTGIYAIVINKRFVKDNWKPEASN
jgi:hypothetical protein